MIQFAPGTIFDERYTLVARLGEGGTGVVFKAIEAGLNRAVALKILSSSLLTDEDSRSRFLREGKVLSQLSHPNLVTFYRFGLWKDTYPYIAMEFLNGHSLRELIEEGSLTTNQCIQIAMQISAAMQSVHERGIIHRDLKPNNIMLSKEGDVEIAKVVDFGLAGFIAARSEQQRLTSTGVPIGSVFYMSPEQCKGLLADARSDIYSLGCVMYEILSGKPPLVAANPIALMRKHVVESPRPLSNRNIENLPVGLESIVFKAMAKEPVHRYRTMDELKTDLALVNAGQSPGALRDELRMRRRTSRVKQVVFVSMVLSVGLTVWQKVNWPATSLQRATSVHLKDGLEECLRNVNRLQDRLEHGAAEDKSRTAVLLINSLDQLATEYERRGQVKDTLLVVHREMALAPFIVASKNFVVEKAYIRMAEIYRRKASAAISEVQRREFLAQSLELLNRVVTSSEGTTVSKSLLIALEFRSAAYVQLGMFKEAKRDFDLAIETATVSGALAGQCYFDLLESDIDQYAKPLSLDDRLILCDILIGISAHQLEMASAEGFISTLRRPRLPKLSPIRGAWQWLLQAFPEIPVSEPGLSQFNRRKQTLKELLAAIKKSQHLQGPKV